MSWIFRLVVVIGLFGGSQVKAESASENLTTNIYVPVSCAESGPDRRAYLHSFTKRVRGLQRVWIEEFGEECHLEEEFRYNYKTFLFSSRSSALRKCENLGYNDATLSVMVAVEKDCIKNRLER